MENLRNKAEQDAMIENVKQGILSKFPLLGATMANLTFEPTNEVATAATDGEKVYYSPEFIEKMTYDEKLFIFSHEIMHDAFDHILRSKGKDHQIWNIATDAVINQMLKKANLPLPKGGVDIPDADSKSAEEMYDILQNKQNEQNKQQNQCNKGNKGQQNSNEQNGQGENTGSHEIWDKAVQKAEQRQQQQQNEQQPNSQDGQQQNEKGQQTNQQNRQQVNQQSEQQNNQQDSKNQSGQQSEQSQSNQENGQQNEQNQASNKQQTQQQSSSSTSPMTSSEKEKVFTQVNEQMKKRIGEEIIKGLLQQKAKIQETGSGAGNFASQFGDVGNAKPAVSWKKLLRKELEKEEDKWSYRRADEDNDYQARMGTQELDERWEMEVMLDTSASVNDELIRNFLRQLKPLLKNSKLKVACFDSSFYGFKEIKNEKDINNLQIIGRGGTNFDNAIPHFSDSAKVNKIVFTDGDDISYLEGKKYKKIIWLVYENTNFQPKSGKVVYVNVDEFNYVKTEPQANKFDNEPTL